MTDVYAIFGFPVSHSRSPAMHNAAFRALDLDAVYVPFAVHPAALPAAISGMRALGIVGANVTLPHKANVMALLDRVEPDARAIGAVNTIFREGDALCGTNTDATGLARALSEAGVELRGSCVVVLGAGGAARATVVGLARAGAKRITVCARRSEEADALKSSLAGVASPCALTSTDLDGSSLARVFSAADLVIQATSATLAASQAADTFARSLPLHALPAHAVVTDLVYKPLQTSVLRAAAERGLCTVDGLGMLLHQGALAFERWTAKTAPIPVMRAALLGNASANP